jgi:hypothetical protein
MDMYQRNYAEATDGGAHIDVPLGRMAVMAFQTGDSEFIGDQLMPAIPVGKESDKYYIIEKGAFLRTPDTLRARSTEARRVRFETSSESYFAHNYALASDIPIEDINTADNAVQLRQNTTKLIATNLRRDQEVRVANLVTSITNIGSGVALTGTAKWGDPSSDPIADVTTAHAFVENTTGLSPNTMVIDKDTMAIVRRHPLLLDMYKYTDGGLVNDAQLREVFGVSRILVGRGIKENALEGGTSSITTIWGNNVIVAHVGMATGLQSQTFGGRFQWRNPAFPAPFGVTRAVQNQAGSKHVEILEAGYYQDEKIIASDLAYAITGTL